jgi:hypothetical protein
MTEALLKTGRHTVTALTRVDSRSKLPDGVVVKPIDYNKPETIVEGLKGQVALVIALSELAPYGVDLALIQAADDAGVPWIFPNEWAPDTANEELVKDVVGFQSMGKRQPPSVCAFCVEGLLIYWCLQDRFAKPYLISAKAPTSRSALAFGTNGVWQSHRPSA